MGKAGLHAGSPSVSNYPPHAGESRNIRILGEAGTGKELLARAIHKMSARKDRPLITVNCAALPPTLIESELFGREEGAYKGAMTKMIVGSKLPTGRHSFSTRSESFLLNCKASCSEFSRRVVSNGWARQRH